MKNLIDLYKNKKLSTGQQVEGIVINHSCLVLESYRQICLCEVKRRGVKSYGLFDVVETHEGTGLSPRIKINEAGLVENLEGTKEKILPIWEEMKSVMLAKDENEARIKKIKQDREKKEQAAEETRRGNEAKYNGRLNAIFKELKELYKENNPGEILKGNNNIDELIHEAIKIEWLRQNSKNFIV